MRSRGFVPGFSIAGNWSRCNLWHCDKGYCHSRCINGSWCSFKCCISTDTKIQASIKHETEVKPIYHKTWFHSSLSCSFRCTWQTHLSAINQRSLLFFFKLAITFLVVIRLVVVQESVVIKIANENLWLSSCSFDLREDVSKEVIRTMAMVNLWPPLCTFGISCKSWELINFNAICTSKLDLQCIQVLKEAFCHYLEGQQMNLNGRRRIFTECKGYANELWHER